MLVPGTVPVGFAVAFTDATPGPSLQIRAPIHFTRILDPSGTGFNTCSLFVKDTTNDAIVVGALLVAKTEDTSAFIGGERPTGADGSAIFVLDNSTTAGYPILVSASTFLTETPYQLVGVTGPTVDTIFVYAFVISPPAGPDSCNVTIFTDDPDATASFEIVEAQHQSTSGIGLNPYVAIAQADVNGIIVQLLPHTAATRQQTKWKITVKNGRQMVMFTEETYEVPTQSVDTVTVTLLGD